jgi:hypothetical protein
MYFEESCFWTMSIVQCTFFKEHFGSWLCFRLQVKRGEGVAPTLSGPLERNSLNHWTSDLKTEAEEASETSLFKEKIGRCI